MKLSNIFVEPKVTFPTEPYVRNDSTGHYRMIRVDGLICESICETRVIKALESIPNIENIYHTPGSNNFIVGVTNKILDKERIESYILSKVIMMKLRKLLSWTKQLFLF